MSPNFRRHILAALFFWTLGCGLSALGRAEPAPPVPVPPEKEPPEEIIIKGRVRLVGSALFSSLVITDEDDRDWYLEGRDRERLARLEQQTVRVRGLPEYRDIILANGQKAGVQRFLRDISLVF